MLGRGSGFYRAGMLIPPARACPGGLGSSPEYGQPGELGTCPVCGPMALGYGGRIPFHELRDRPALRLGAHDFGEPRVDRVA